MTIVSAVSKVLRDAGMTPNLQRRDDMPPDLEEGYWEALLREGEFAEATALGTSEHREVAADHNGHSESSVTGKAQQELDLGRRHADQGA